MAGDRTGSSSTAKRNASPLNVMERIPKRAKATQPDLTIAIGKNKVELPKMETEEWLLVYKFIDPSIEMKTKEDIFVSLLDDGSRAIKEEDSHYSMALRVLKWMDFFGIDRLCSRLDESAEEFLLDFYYSESGDVSLAIATFVNLRTSPLPE